MSTSLEIKVLIVEDDLMIQRILTEFLKKIKGYTLVGVASDYVSAKNFIESTAIDFVLLDIYLPGGLGIDLLKWIRQQERAIDALLITADNRSETLEKAMRFGAVDYLIKPFRFSRFQEALKRYLIKKAQLHNKIMMDQENIDQLMRLNQNLTYEESTNQTFESIMVFLQKNGNQSYTSSEIAKSLGISRITARRYLEEMENDGIVVLELAYGGVGRPKNLYRFLGGRNEN
ncbi:MAG: two-component system response regulator [Firmicutes bacterium HGW-Firmicutes-3]|jgi:response regulator of citrate/malate metabolism|nr:MAG: two-component system response regulator [Firmicutes bacterium HGW-Firmicutes-3]